MNPTNESIGRAFDDVAYSDDDLHTIVQDWDESDPIQKTAMDLALKVLRLREADGARELDRQAPGDAGRLRHGFLLSNALTEELRVLRVDYDPADTSVGIMADCWHPSSSDLSMALGAAVARVPFPAPQPPAQEQGEVDLRYDLVQQFAAAHKFDYNKFCTFIRSVIITRAAGAEDARDAELAVVQRFAEILPGPIYMDPPDGGDVSVFEQFSRMARDAERYRWLRNEAIRFEDERGSPWVVYGLGQSDSCPTDGTELDAMVDAAIASQAKEGEA